MERTIWIEVRAIGKSEIGTRVRESRGSTGKGRNASIMVVKPDDGNRGLKVIGYSYKVSGKGDSVTGYFQVTSVKRGGERLRFVYNEV